MRIQLYTPSTLDEKSIHHKFIVVLRHYLSTFTDVELTDVNPDLVHVFGGITSANKMKIAECNRLKIPVLYSPLSALQPWEVSSLTHTTVLNKSLSNYLLQNIAAFHVCNKIEKEVIEQKTEHHSVSLIANSVITSQLTDKEMVEKMRSLYVETIHQYDISIKESIVKQVANLKEISEPIASLCHDFLYIHYLYGKKNISKTLLSALVNKLHHSEYDEDKMKEVIEELKLTSFITELEGVLKERFSLLEGFMPIPFDSGKIAEEIEERITDYTH